jgi:hypothetical protein
VDLNVAGLEPESQDQSEEQMARVLMAMAVLGSFLGMALAICLVAQPPTIHCGASRYTPWDFMAYGTCIRVMDVQAGLVLTGIGWTTVFWLLTRSK